METLAFKETLYNSAARKVVQHKEGQKPQNTSEVFMSVKGLILDKVGVHLKLSSFFTWRKNPEQAFFLFVFPLSLFSPLFCSMQLILTEQSVRRGRTEQCRAQSMHLSLKGQDVPLGQERERGS